MTTKTFQIPDQDDSIIFEETHYFKWLEANSVENLHHIHTKMGYLLSLGFKKGHTILTVVEGDRLRYIENYFVDKQRTKSS